MSNNGTTNSNLRDENGVDARVVLEVLQNLNSLVLRCITVEERFVHVRGVAAKGEHVVGKYDYLKMIKKWFENVRKSRSTDID